MVFPEMVEFSSHTQMNQLNKSESIEKFKEFLIKKK